MIAQSSRPPCLNAPDGTSNSTGRVQPGLGGSTRVARPANLRPYERSAPRGDEYVSCIPWRSAGFIHRPTRSDPSPPPRPPFVARKRPDEVVDDLAEPAELRFAPAASIGVLAAGVVTAVRATSGETQARWAGTESAAIRAAPPAVIAIGRRPARGGIARASPSSAATRPSAQADAARHRRSFEP